MKVKILPDISLDSHESKNRSRDKSRNKKIRKVLKISNLLYIETKLQPEVNRLPKSI